MEIARTEVPVPQTSPKPGVVVRPATGEAVVPTDDGNVRVEVKSEGGNTHFMFQDTPASKKLLDMIIERTGVKAEASAAQGKVYEPTMGARVKNLLTTHVSPTKALVLVFVGYGVIKLAGWTARKAAEYFGWNMFGNIVADEEEMFAGGNKDFDERKAPRPRRQTQAPPTQPSAMA